MLVCVSSLLKMYTSKCICLGLFSVADWYTFALVISSNRSMFVGSSQNKIEMRRNMIMKGSDTQCNTVFTDLTEQWSSMAHRQRYIRFCLNRQYFTVEWTYCLMFSWELLNIKWRITLDCLRSVSALGVESCCCLSAVLTRTEGRLMKVFLIKDQQ